MNTKKIIAVVITARPSYSRIKTVLLALRDNPNIDLRIILNSSAVLERFGNVAAVIENDGFEISERIYNSIEGDDIVATAPKDYGRHTCSRIRQHVRCSIPCVTIYP